MPKSVIKLVAPTGWEINGKLISKKESTKWLQSTSQKYFEFLYKWANENELNLTVIDTDWFTFSYNDFKLPIKFSFSGADFELVGNIPCHRKSCNAKVTPGHVSCSKGHYSMCGSCNTSAVPIFEVTRVRGGTVTICGRCGLKCKNGCGVRCFAAEHKNDWNGNCTNCTPQSDCARCGYLYPTATILTALNKAGNEIKLCGPCHRATVCSRCNGYESRLERAVNTNDRICKLCSMAEFEKDRAKFESFEKEELPVSGNLFIDSLPDRPFRTISIETEVNGQKDVLATTLFRCGIVRKDEVESYGTFPDIEAPWPAHLKHDGSVTGGELISYCMNLDDKSQADVLLATLGKLRSLHKLNKITYDENCGGHIHIDAHNFGLGDVWRLMTIWNYLEDVIYRLAGAGHKYSHRSLVAGHDRANRGGGYAGKPIKGPFGTKGKLGENLRYQARMSGLNFVPYFSASGSCQCGAFRNNGDGRNCTCNLPKCTIEWRVWNSQGNPRILHAWIAFMQAMHAYADQGIDPDDKFEQNHPVFEFTSQPFKSCKQAHKDTTKERLKWIFRNLTLTNVERDSLVYALKQSELIDLGVIFLDSLLDVVPVAASGNKVIPRNPVRRKTPIVMKSISANAAKKAPTPAMDRPDGDVFMRALMQERINMVIHPNIVEPVFRGNERF